MIISLSLVIRSRLRAVTIGLGSAFYLNSRYNLPVRFSAPPRAVSSAESSSDVRTLRPFGAYKKTAVSRTLCPAVGRKEVPSSLSRNN